MVHFNESLNIDPDGKPSTRDCLATNLVPTNLAEEADHSWRKALSEIIAKFNFRLRTFGRGGTLMPRITVEARSSAHLSHTHLPQMMIKPSVHQSVLIDFHRDDWP
jgi:hypothetical protein